MTDVIIPPAPRGPADVLREAESTAHALETLLREALAGMDRTPHRAMSARLVGLVSAAESLSWEVRVISRRAGDHARIDDAINPPFGGLRHG